MCQDLVIFFPYLRDRPVAGNTVFETLAWSDDEEKSNCEDSMNQMETDEDDAAARVELNKQRRIHISLCLGSGRAFRYYIRGFIIAQYRATQDEEAKKCLIQYAPPKYQDDQNPVNYSAIRDIQDLNTFGWIQQLVDSDSNGLFKREIDIDLVKDAIKNMQKLIPFLPMKQEDLQGTPYRFQLNGDLCDERYIKLVHYLTKALRYNAALAF